MTNLDKIIDVFCALDDFYKEFYVETQKHMIEQNCSVKKRNRQFAMSESEVMTIVILFHLGGYKCFKHYYIYHVQKHMTSEFPKTVSYNRFVELMPKVMLAISIFAKTFALGSCTGITFIDSTKIVVCHNKRIKANKVFKDYAKTGKSTMGWFHGFKLHLVINEKGEILDFVVTPGNADDREPLKSGCIIKKIFGKIFGDKGYIGQELIEKLFIDNVHLITQGRKNMKDNLMLLYDRIMLRKRSLIETVNDELKNICQIEHTRHRSVVNFLVNLFAGLIAYNFLPKKPSIKCEVIDRKKLGIGEDIENKLVVF